MDYPGPWVSIDHIQRLITWKMKLQNECRLEVNCPLQEPKLEDCHNKIRIAKNFSIRKKNLNFLEILETLLFIILFTIQKSRRMVNLQKIVSFWNLPLTIMLPFSSFHRQEETMNFQRCLLVLSAQQGQLRVPIASCPVQEITLKQLYQRCLSFIQERLWIILRFTFHLILQLFHLL